MLQVERYNDFKYGVINAIEPSEIPKEAVNKSQNLYYRENRWRKLPGLVEMTGTPIGTDPVCGVGKHYDIIAKKRIVLGASGGGVYRFNDQTKLFESIYSGMFSNEQVEFLNYPPHTYFGSPNNKWRRYDGGTITYPVGGNSGAASDAPRKFSNIIFSPYSGRFFGIGEILNPDYLYWSEHIDNEGIEKWPDGNVQIIESIRGDSPKAVDIFEARITIFNENSISSGTVSGVPQSWSFQRDRAQSGCYAGRTLKRYGTYYLMMTPDFEVYKWPTDSFITKGRVKFEIDPYSAHLACAEIVENRYYVITFKSSHAVSSDKYHTWVYDILGDRWYGPHIQRNVVSMFFDRDTNYLLCGGTDDLAGLVMDMRGTNIKNKAMKCHFMTGFNFQGDIRSDKRYSMFRLKSKQTGSLAGGVGQLEVLINCEQKYDAPHTTRLTFEDPANDNPMDTGAVKDAIIKRAHIHEENSRGTSIQVELKHEILNGEMEFSEFDIEYRSRTKKEDRKI